MAKYYLSPQAEKSLIQISEYTLKNFGEKQRRTYLSLLREHMRKVATAPGTGRERAEIKAGYYSVLAGKHHIYYRIAEGYIEIIDVLHQSMEPQLHLQ